MRIVIQHAQTRSFFDGSIWDANEQRAAQFENVTEAEQFCRAQNLSNALIVLKFKDGDEDVSYRALQLEIPMRSERRAPNVRAQA